VPSALLDSDLTSDTISCIKCGQSFVRRRGYHGNYCPSHRPTTDSLDSDTEIEIDLGEYGVDLDGLTDDR